MDLNELDLGKSVRKMKVELEKKVVAIKQEEKQRRSKLAKDNGGSAVAAARLKSSKNKNNKNRGGGWQEQIPEDIIADMSIIDIMGTMNPCGPGPCDTRDVLLTVPTATTHSKSKRSAPKATVTSRRKISEDTHEDIMMGKGGEEAEVQLFSDAAAADSSKRNSKKDKNKNKKSEMDGEEQTGVVFRDSTPQDETEEPTKKSASATNPLRASSDSSHVKNKKASAGAFNRAQSQGRAGAGGRRGAERDGSKPRRKSAPRPNQPIDFNVLCACTDVVDGMDMVKGLAGKIKKSRVSPAGKGDKKTKQKQLAEKGTAGAKRKKKSPSPPVPAEAVPVKVVAALAGDSNPQAGGGSSSQSSVSEKKGDKGDRKNRRKRRSANIDDFSSAYTQSGSSVHSDGVPKGDHNSYGPPAPIGIQASIEAGEKKGSSEVADQLRDSANYSDVVSLSSSILVGRDDKRGVVSDTVGVAPANAVTADLANSAERQSEKSNAAPHSMYADVVSINSSILVGRYDKRGVVSDTIEVAPANAVTADLANSAERQSEKSNAAPHSMYADVVSINSSILAGRESSAEAFADMVKSTEKGTSEADDHDTVVEDSSISDVWSKVSAVLSEVLGNPVPVETKKSFEASGAPQSAVEPAVIKVNREILNEFLRKHRIKQEKKRLDYVKWVKEE